MKNAHGINWFQSACNHGNRCCPDVWLVEERSLINKQCFSDVDAPLLWLCVCCAGRRVVQVEVKSSPTGGSCGGWRSVFNTPTHPHRHNWPFEQRLMITYVISFKETETQMWVLTLLSSPAFYCISATSSLLHNLGHTKVKMQNRLRETEIRRQCCSKGGIVIIWRPVYFIFCFLH